MGKRLIFVGAKANGYFAYEEALSKGWDIDFVETTPNYIKKQVADISAAADKGCDCIIYDTREYLEDAEIIADVIASIRRANGAKPILVVPTANKENALIGACLNKDIKLFINAGAGTPTDWKRELVLSITGHYDAEENEPRFTKEARDYHNRRAIRNDSFLTVGVAGSLHRIGTTTQAMQITRFLLSMGYKACLVEMNSNKYENKSGNAGRKRSNSVEQLSFLEKTRLIFDVEIDEPERGYIRNQGLDMYYRQDLLSELFDMNYDYIVYDYGVYTDPDFNRPAFLKDNLQFFCVGAGAVEADYAFKIAENLSYKKANLIFSFTAEGDRDEIRLAMDDCDAGSRCFFAGYTPNPYILSDLDLYSAMLPVTENESTVAPLKKKRGIFGRLKHE